MQKCSVMRRSASWQSAPDDRILEIAAEDQNGVVKVGNLAEHPYIHVGQSQVSRRCKKLAEHDLLRPLGDGVYVITEEGRGYLEERYDVQRGVWLDSHQAEEEPSAGKDVEEANGA